MTVSLGWLLAQPDLRLRLVTDVPDTAAVSWVHPIDAADPSPWLSGGELVLTTGLGVGPSPAEQRAYVERLADAGVSGMGFGVGLAYAEIPTAIVEACTERSVALVEVPLPTPFIAITQAFVGRLSEQEVESLQQGLTYQRRITRAAVRGGLPGLVRALGHELRCDAVALDEYGSVMASSTRDKTLLDRIATECARLSKDRRGGTVGIPTEHGTLEVQTLRGRSTVVGWLAVRHRDAPTPTDRLLLNQAAGLITLQLDWPAELIAAYHAVGGTLLDLLLDPAQDAASLIRHLHHFGFDPSAPVVVAVATAPRVRARLIRVLADKLEATGRPHVVSRTAGGAVLLLLTRDAHDLVALLDRAADDSGLGNVVIGVSCSLPQIAVATGLAPALLAAETAQRKGRRVGWFEDLSLSALLADEAVWSRVWTLAAPALDALERGATSREGELLPSLEAFLHHNGSVETAARALGVHRHTLRARMARVEELTGLRLDGAESRVLLMLGLMSRRRSLSSPETNASSP